jgi:hypothetical protein
MLPLFLYTQTNKMNNLTDYGTESKINKISKQVQAHLDKYPLTGIAKFRMLNGTPNVDPQAKAFNKTFYPSITTIHYKSRFTDPGTKQPVEIGKVIEFNEKGAPVRWERKHVHGYEKGQIVLMSESMDDAEAYPIFQLHNENLSNPFRDTSVVATFERVDVLKEDSLAVRMNNKLFKAWQAIDYMDIADKRLYHAANGGGYDDETITVDANLQRLAQADPEKFSTMIDSPLTKIKSTVKQCHDKNLVQYDAQQHRYLWVGGETIATLNRVEGQSETTQFAEWLNTNKNGTQILSQMNNLLSPKEEKVKK